MTRRENLASHEAYPLLRIGFMCFQLRDFLPLFLEKRQPTRIADLPVAGQRYFSRRGIISWCVFTRADAIRFSSSHQAAAFPSSTPRLLAARLFHMCGP